MILDPFGTYDRSTVSALAIVVKKAEDNASVEEDIMVNLQGQRLEVSGVNLDEEATNLVMFQKSYQASARFFTVINELLDVLINQLGR